MTTIESPTGLDHDLLARIGPVMDIDSHEMIPLHMWPEAFGQAAVTFTNLATNTGMVDNLGENSMRRDDLGADDDAVDPATIWNLKGPAAPSAISPDGPRCSTQWASSASSSTPTSPSSA